MNAFLNQLKRLYHDIPLLEMKVLWYLMSLPHCAMYRQTQHYHPSVDQLLLSPLENLIRTFFALTTNTTLSSIWGPTAFIAS
jgi:hypothetical protein